MITFLTAGGKLNALTRTIPFVGLSKGSTLRNTFLNPQFSYCPLFGCQIIGKYRGFMRYAYVLSTMIMFSVVLSKYGSVSVHMRNIQSVPIKMFVISSNLNVFKDIT